MAATAGALAAVGVQVRPRQPGEDRLAGIDCLHLFGSLADHLPVVEAARRQDVPVVLSPIAWFDLASYWRQPRRLPGRLAACGRFLARAAWPQLPSWRGWLYRRVDLLLPNSQAEAEQLVRYFKIPRRRIHVVPNGADERFARPDPQSFVGRFGIRDFVLLAGRIEPRKNQLAVLRAMRDVDVPIVVLGDVVPGHEAYLAKCRRAAGSRVRFVGRVAHTDPMLGGAYAACGCLVLAGWYETPGLVALEAGMSGVPLVLPQRGAAREYFGNHAEYVKPGDHAAIRREILAALARGRSRELARHVQRNYSWTATARATREAYEKILRVRSGA